MTHFQTPSRVISLRFVGKTYNMPKKEFFDLHIFEKSKYLEELFKKYCKNRGDR